MSKYSKQDEKIIKDLMNTLYDHHQSLKGGSFFTDFLHGFTIPFKQFGHLLSLIPEVGPALASVVTPVAEAVDKMVPGARYATIGDALSGKKVEGSGKRGRPKKKQGSGLIDILGEAYNISKAKHEKKITDRNERISAYNAKKAPTDPIVGGNIFKDAFKEVYKGAKYIRNPAEVITDLTPKTGRGRPKGSKNKKM